ncbi:3-deoxy-8-phosphooctulonate synthase [bacterium]|nr:3-deoxy-8-phosphooctulonate synthase [candidate division CSSED10-310 bacterium]
MRRTIALRDFVIGDGQLVLIAGPCVVESERHALSMAAALRDITTAFSLPFIFKSSYDKANRTSQKGYRGIGVRAGLAALAAVKKSLDLPILTDIHNSDQAAAAAAVADVLQIPAFLSRQTDLLQAAGHTGKPVNIKKGQFLAPWDMARSAEKVAATGNHDILLTERGASFGYNNLVVDMRSLLIMRRTGYPVVFDATHSVQLPSGRGDASDGQREFVFPLARAAVATGVDALFLEVHDQPDEAPCDGPNMLALEDLELVLRTIMAIHETSRPLLGGN